MELFDPGDKPGWLGMEYPMPENARLPGRRIGIARLPRGGSPPNNYRDPRMRLFRDNVISRTNINYFEVDVKSLIDGGSIVISIIPSTLTPADRRDLYTSDISVAVDITTGLLLRKGGLSEEFAPECTTDDVIGVRVDFEQSKNLVTFTRNGELYGKRLTIRGPTFIAVAHFNYLGEGLNFRFEEPGERVSLDDLEEMQCDHMDDQWNRLDGALLNGDLITYNGTGDDEDVAFAQATQPLSPSNHYFELEILNRGSKGFIAIGMAHNQYSAKKQPGWGKGSVGYHADDGGIFVESGHSEEKVAICQEGDRMGCGILFPRDFEEARLKALEAMLLMGEDQNDELETRPLHPKSANQAKRHNRMRRGDNQRYHRHRMMQPRHVWAMASVEIDDYHPQEQLDCGMSVDVFFTRNGLVVSTKRIALPPEGLFPTIGLMSPSAKVRVDLKPLSG